MNPAFILIVFIAAFLLWLLLSFIFVPVGKLFNKLFKNSNKAMHSGGKIIFRTENSFNGVTV